MSALILSRPGGGASVTVSETPPSNPSIGDLWYSSETGTLYVNFDDGDSVQWVATAGGGSGGGEWGSILGTLSSQTDLQAELDLKLGTTGLGEWKVFHTNGDGDLVELALGESGQVLTSNGETAAPTFEDAAGGGEWGSITGTLSSQTDLADALAAGNARIFDAADFIPRVTNGAGAASLTETTTNKVMADLLSYDPATAQFAQVTGLWPAGWATATAQVIWQGTDDADLARQVRWTAALRVLTDGDAIDSAFGTAVGVSDAIGAVSTWRYTAETAAITPAGTVGDLKRFYLQLGRDPDHADDNYASAAFAAGVILRKAS